MAQGSWIHLPLQLSRDKWPEYDHISACGGLGSKKLRIEIQSGNQGVVAWMSLCCLLWSWGSCVSPWCDSPLPAWPRDWLFFLSFPPRLNSSCIQLETNFFALQCCKPAGCSPKQVDNVVPVFDFRCLYFIFGRCTMQKEIFFFFF